MLYLKKHLLIVYKFLKCGNLDEIAKMVYFELYIAIVFALTEYIGPIFGSKRHS